MHSLLALNYPLQSIIWSKDNQIIKQILLVILGVVLLALSSQISIPLEPISLTFQSAMVILLGLTYGSRLASHIVWSYLLLGLMGAPVFANMSFGLAILMGPKGGFYLGFLFASLISGYLAENGWAKNAFTTFLAAIIADIILFSSGVISLSSFVGWEKAYLLGVKPFWITEVFKLGLVALIAPRFWKPAKKFS